MVPGKTNATQFATLPSPHRASHVSSRVIKSFQYTKRPAASSGRQHACGHQRCWSSTSASFPGNPADSPCRSPGRRLNTVLVSSARWPPRWGRFGRHLLGRFHPLPVLGGSRAEGAHHFSWWPCTLEAVLIQLLLARKFSSAVVHAGQNRAGLMSSAWSTPVPAVTRLTSADICSAGLPQWASVMEPVPEVSRVPPVAPPRC